MKYYISIALLISMLSSISAQVSSPAKRATVKKYIPKQPINDNTLLNEDNAHIAVQHFDATMRPLQTVGVNASGLGTDIVQPYQYDEYGRQSKRYLPYALSEVLDNEFHPNDGEYRSSAVDYANMGEQTEFYSDINLSGLDKASTSAYSETQFEDAYRSRPLKQGSVGEDFQLNGTNTFSYQYKRNRENEVIKLRYDEDELYIVEGYWMKGSLIKTITINPEGKRVETFKNANGNVVSSKTWGEADGNTDEQVIYFLYNDFGQLILEVPISEFFIQDRPVSQITSNTQISTPIQSSQVHDIEAPATISYLPGCSINSEAGVHYTAGYDVASTRSREEKEKLVTQYQYDANNRLIAKKHPGAEWEYYVYDKLGRVAMAQNGELRASGLWAYTKYDRFGRLVYSGTTTSFNDREYHAEAILSSQLYETRAPGDQEGYSQIAYPGRDYSVPWDIGRLNFVFYDSYNLFSYDNFGISFDGTLGGNYASSYNTNVKGLVTCSRSRILNSFNFHTTAIYYDNKYRPIQIHSFTPDIEQRISVVYNFNGQVTQTLTQSTFTGGTTTEVEKWYTYNDAGRLTDIEQEINGGTRVKMVSYVYNALGQLETEKIHYSSISGNYLQEVDYLRNIQGKLVSINNIDQSIDLKNGTEDLFAMKFGYHEILEGLTTTNDVRHDGSITGAIWRSRANDGTTLEKKAYKYRYDGVGRFMEAEYSAGELLNQDADMYSVSMKGYDKFGNILGITRHGADGLIDDLSYTYDGYQLQSVSDASDNTLGFNDGADISSEYSYNTNGNMYIDHNKGIAQVDYNYLNLPKLVTMEEGHTVEYTYTAAGTKLRKKAADNAGTVVSDVYYFNGFEYDCSGTLTQIHNGRSRIRMSGSTHKIDYTITDNLGNVRVMFTESSDGTVEEVQVNDYYPFGMRFNQGPTFQTQGNNYTYSGKELQQDFDLNWTDHHARFFDPALGRWHAQDPLHQFSNPYLAMGNNPVMRIDRNGGEDMYFDSFEQLIVFCWNNVDAGGHGYFDINSSGGIDMDNSFTIDASGALYDLGGNPHMGYQIDNYTNGGYHIENNVSSEHNIYKHYGYSIVKDMNGNVVLDTRTGIESNRNIPDNSGDNNSGSPPGGWRSTSSSSAGVDYAYGGGSYGGPQSGGGGGGQPASSGGGGDPHPDLPLDRPLHAADNLANQRDQQRANNPYDPGNFNSYEDWRNAMKNSPEQQQIRANHAAETQRLETRWQRQDNFVEVTGIVVGAAAEYSIGFFTGLLILLPPGYGQGPYYGPMPPLEQ